MNKEQQELVLSALKQYKEACIDGKDFVAAKETKETIEIFKEEQKGDENNEDNL